VAVFFFLGGLFSEGEGKGDGQTDERLQTRRMKKERYPEERLEGASCYRLDVMMEVNKSRKIEEKRVADRLP
jgi:hypothetical protein